MFGPTDTPQISSQHHIYNLFSKCSFVKQVVWAELWAGKTFLAACTEVVVNCIISYTVHFPHSICGPRMTGNA